MITEQETRLTTLAIRAVGGLSPRKIPTLAGIAVRTFIPRAEQSAHS